MARAKHYEKNRSLVSSRENFASRYARGHGQCARLWVRDLAGTRILCLFDARQLTLTVSLSTQV